jgi:hypothetical protein
MITLLALAHCLITAETLSPSCKAVDRQRLADELGAFLSRGGKIQNVIADAHTSKA